MVEKTAKNKVDQAIDIAYAQVKKESGITPMDLFMVGMGYTGVGLAIVNTARMPESARRLHHHHWTSRDGHDRAEALKMKTIRLPLGFLVHVLRMDSRHAPAGSSSNMYV